MKLRALNLCVFLLAKTTLLWTSYGRFCSVFFVQMYALSDEKSGKDWGAKKIKFMLHMLQTGRIRSKLPYKILFHTGAIVDCAQLFS